MKRHIGRFHVDDCSPPWVLYIHIISGYTYEFARGFGLGSWCWMFPCLFVLEAGLSDISGLFSLWHDLQKWFKETSAGICLGYTKDDKTKVFCRFSVEPMRWLMPSSPAYAFGWWADAGETGRRTVSICSLVGRTWATKGFANICKYLRKWLLVSISLNQFAVIFLPLPTYDGQLQLNATDLFSLDGSEKKLYLHVNWCRHPMMVKEAAGSDLKCREVTEKIGTGIATMHSASMAISGT